MSNLELLNQKRLEAILTRKKNEAKCLERQAQHSGNVPTSWNKVNNEYGLIRLGHYNTNKPSKQYVKNKVRSIETTTVSKKTGMVYATKITG